MNCNYYCQNLLDFVVHRTTMMKTAAYIHCDNSYWFLLSDQHSHYYHQPIDHFLEENWMGYRPYCMTPMTSTMYRREMDLMILVIPANVVTTSRVAVVILAVHKEEVVMVVVDSHSNMMK